MILVLPSSNEDSSSIWFITGKSTWKTTSKTIE